jgi:hypothetical protein
MEVQMDLDTPQGRLAATRALGTEAYNGAMRRHIQQQAVETVNGYPIRPVNSPFGRLFQIVGAHKAFSALADAREHAKGLRPASEVMAEEIRSRMADYRRSYDHSKADTYHNMAPVWAENSRRAFNDAARELSSLTGEHIEFIAAA